MAKSKKFNYNDYEEDRTFYPPSAVKKEGDDRPIGEGKIKPEENQIFEAAGMVAEGIELADAMTRSMAMATVLTWVDEGDFTYEAMNQMLLGVADLDGDEVLTEEEMEIYHELLPEVSNAMLTLGADPANVTEFLDGESDEAGAKLGGYLSGVMDSMPADDAEIVTTFATGEDGALFECADGIDPEDAIYEATFKKTKVVKDGKVVIKKKRVSGRGAKRSAKQKAALKKARRKGSSSASKMKRKKTMKLRKKKGL